jgi:hypothetical protein
MTRTTLMVLLEGLFASTAVICPGKNEYPADIPDALSSSIVIPPRLSLILDPSKCHQDPSNNTGTR